MTWSEADPLSPADITGDLRVFLEAMGTTPDSPQFHDLLELLPGAWESADAFRDGSTTVRGHNASAHGVRMTLEGGKLKQVLLHLEPAGPVTGPYPRIPQLCDQLDLATADRAGVLARFGEPYKTQPAWDMFRIGPRLTVIYRPDTTVKKVSILA